MNVTTFSIQIETAKRLTPAQKKEITEFLEGYADELRDRLPMDIAQSTNVALSDVKVKIDVRGPSLES